MSTREDKCDQDGTCCAVPGCSRRTGHVFPMSDPSRVKEWCIAIKRDYFKPSKFSIVCKDHFDSSDYKQKTASGTVPLQKILLKTAVPHIFSWCKKRSNTEIERIARATKRQKLQDQREAERGEACNFIAAHEIIEAVPEVETTPAAAVFQDIKNSSSKVESSDASTQINDTRRMRARHFALDPAGIHFYTGLENYAKFLFVLDTLGPAAYQLRYHTGTPPQLMVEDQFFLTLIKLRRHKENFELSRDFNITEGGVTNIFVTWINFMALEWGGVNWWPSRDLVRYFCPMDFKAKFPKTRVIVDGTECPIMKPSQPVAQQATFSTYKNCNTAKVLVGVSPGGLVSFVSSAYGGSASDRQICERSGLPSLCDPGDSVMADKGFDVQDLFDGSLVHLNIPTFFRKKNRMSGATVLRDRKIASKRVHVERIIGLAKTFKILKKPMNNTISSLASEIIKVCFYLCNFRSGIVPNTS